jgi:hypothetical protein
VVWVLGIGGCLCIAAGVATLACESRRSGRADPGPIEMPAAVCPSCGYSGDGVEVSLNGECVCGLCGRVFDLHSSARFDE